MLAVHACAADAGGAQLHTVGLLVVEATVPGSPADGVLEPGDVLVRVQGQVGAGSFCCQWVLRGTCYIFCASEAGKPA
jgi:hypothetical protein